MEDEKIIEKSKLRKEYIKARASMPLEESRASDVQIAEHILNSDLYRDAKSVFVFISVEGEIDTTPVIHRAFSDGKSVMAPRTKEERVLEAVPIGAEEFLKRARTDWPRCYNIPEPPDDLPAAESTGLDLVIVPSLALDKWGYRLGYGGGFYDHFIKTARAQKNSPVFAAVQRAAFLRDEALPREPYDEPVDLIVTEYGIVIPSSASV